MVGPRSGVLAPSQSQERAMSEAAAAGMGRLVFFSRMVANTKATWREGRADSRRGGRGHRLSCAFRR